MSIRQKQRIIITILIILLLIVIIERTYNSRDEFQVTAEDASYYDIVEAKIETKVKLEDFEYLYNVLEENYPFFKVNERLHEIDWLGNKRRYKRVIRNTKNDAEFFVAMDKILGDLNNKHVNIFDGKSFKQIYKSYYERFSRDNALEYLPMYEAFSNPYVMYRYNIEGNLEDIELYKEAILETQVLIEGELAYIKIKDMTSSDIVTKDYKEIRKFISEVEDYEKLIIDIRGNSGYSDDCWKSIVELLIDEPLSANYYAFFKAGHRYTLDPYKVEGTTTIKLLDKEILNKFPKEVKNDFDFYKRYSININPWDESSDSLDKINFSGKIYILVDENVTLASENFASFAKDTGFATLVGESTGGQRVFEEIPVIYLPKSKFVVRYSRELGINQDGSINMETKTIPHIQADPTPHEDFNKDACIQEVIRD